ncbi:hypothetical protein PBRA_006047 [Plasmodiophora brassicae]|uniref:Uncharacterized protein n=1 Tax=Plasmodiophora brassicae TaxID=37360 RepID=A0A0G4IRB9_PLABS|nr:hypothetical protein PBRA_006047 [Plasmodiophora brassicae]
MRPNRRLSSIGKEMSVKQANQSIHQWLQAEFLAKDSPFLVFLSHPSVADADLINALSAREPVDSIRQRIESCVAQLNRDRLVNKLIVDGMLSELGLLIDAGVSVGRPRRVGVVQFSHLDLAGAQYDLYPSDRAFDIVLLLAQHTPRATSLPALASLIRHVNLTADQIEALAMAIVSGNADGFLLTTILTLANVLQQSGVDVVSHRQRLQRTATRLTHVATGILVDMKSDRLVSIALEAKDDDGQSPIDVALQTNNVALVGPVTTKPSSGANR